MGYLDALNPEQKAAVLHTEGPLLILAGAGSGKTRVIISRIVHLMEHHGVAGHNILAVTFTNKAADEMRSRVRELLRESGVRASSLPLLCTFHSFCVRLLRQHGEPLAEFRPGFTASFNIYDDGDQLAVVKDVYRRLGLDEKFLRYRSALAALSSAKNRAATPADLYKSASSGKDEKLAVIFERYQEALLGANALDFDDLLLEAVRLLRGSEAVREWANDRYRYVLVDEYQDTNRPQYDLMRLLTARHKNICAVGDEDQSIYSWRGADIRNILDFERDYPETEIIRLEQNYRSTENILQAAGRVVARNVQRKGKNLWTRTPAGAPIVVYRAPSAESEALFIAGYVSRYLEENPGEQAAILYRMNAQSRQIEEALRRYNRSYVVVGGLSFYQRAEVKDLIAYLKCGISPADTVSLLRILNKPARGIGRTTLEQIQAHAGRERLSVWEAIADLIDEQLLPARAHAALTGFRRLVEQIGAQVRERPVDESLRWIFEHTGYRQMLQDDPSHEASARLENVQELIAAATEAAARGEDVHAFLDHAALVSDTDELDTRAELLLMTLHSAKGLEFPLVVIAGMEENIFPHSRSLNTLDAGALEEERRLCYVGMTRARKQLLLTWAASRRLYGGRSPDAMMPSRFLREIPPELVQEESAGSLGRQQMLEYADESGEDLDLALDRHEVRQIAESRLYPGKTYESADHIAEFFQKRGIAFPPGGASRPAADHAARPSRPPARKPPAKPRYRPGAKPPLPRPQFRPGTRVEHAKWGAGIVLRQEGAGDDAKVSVLFERHGRKKLVLKYANLQSVR